jgi:hypothetical protein
VPEKAEEVVKALPELLVEIPYRSLGTKAEPAEAERAQAVRTWAA